jgi:two-component system OmpR family response regulator/two-component system alkaline phosphatase synthesis response regulator PhoP
VKISKIRYVLIVDDDESIRLLLRRILESIPALDLTLAGSCQEALQLASEHTYDLILLDLLMPGIGGIEVLNRIRKSPPNEKTAVIIVSVMSDSDTKIVCKSLGVSDYLTKPIDRNSVLSAVNTQLSSAAG